MAIALTDQPTADGLYSAYLPVKFVATETANNPAYLTFSLRTSAGAAIPNVPNYIAANINNTYTFDASSYLTSILNILTTQGYSTTAIEELTDLYGKYEVVVKDTINSLTDLTSNEFYAFGNIDGLRYLNDQTANDGINRKGLLYGSAISGDYYAPKFQGTYDRVVLFPQMVGAANPYLAVYTYSENRPSTSSSLIQTLTLDLVSYRDKLISVPITKTFIDANFAVSGGGAISAYNSFKLKRLGSNNAMFYYYEDRCNITEFVFINKYGVKENIKFQSYNYAGIKTQSDSYRTGGYVHTGNTFNFNTSANNVKINQNNVENFEIKGQFFTSKHSGVLKDFACSPLHWLVDPTPQRWTAEGVSTTPELIAINVIDGDFKGLIKSRGVEFNFKYQYAQTKPSFK